MVEKRTIGGITYMSISMGMKKTDAKKRAEYVRKQNPKRSVRVIKVQNGRHEVFISKVATKV